MARHTFLRARFFLHMLQQNGYKLKEFWQWMIDHWGSRVITPRHLLYMVIIVVMLWLLSTTITGSAAIIILSIFGIFWFGPFDYYQSSQPKKTLAYTPRLLRLCVPFGVLSLLLPVVGTWLAFTGKAIYQPGLFSVDIYILAFGWILANTFIPFFIIPAAFSTKPVEKQIHQHFINQAKEKLASMPGLQVVAITGSYGKTSTKFMIRDLLKERMSVCITPGSYNTPMGICKVINNDLEAHHQVLVLEMGARYEGNIDELCDIAEPDISVITNVGIAHLETFGSQDAIARTKSTLVRRLKPGGTAVLNMDDPRVAQMAALRDDVSIIETGLDEQKITATDLQYDTEGSRFTVCVGDQEELFSTRLLGAHNVQNILLAVGVASCFDIRLKTMAVAGRSIEPVEHRLELKKQGDLYVIDDAFNSNPVGAKNAVEILAQFNSGQRFIITPGMIELGEAEDAKNREFGQQIGRANLDLVVLVGKRQTAAIQEGIAETPLPKERVKVVNNLGEANEQVCQVAKPGDVVLYENDLPDSFDE